MNIASQLRHFLTFLAGLGTLFLGWHLIAPDQVAAVNKAGGDLIEPLLVIIGAVGVFLFRALLSWLGKKFTAKVEAVAEKSSGGMSGGALLLAGLCTMTTLLGVGLSSCSSLTGVVSYRDPATGAKGGLVFIPGKPVQGTVKVPIRDPQTGVITGTADLGVNRSSGN